jgi:hypothetical protein
MKKILKNSIRSNSLKISVYFVNLKTFDQKKGGGNLDSLKNWLISKIEKRLRYLK